MAYRLHCFCQSGNAFKVANMLNLLGEPWEPVLVDFFNGETRDPAWRASVNETGEAPVLEDGDLKLAQSGVILDHLPRSTAASALAIRRSAARSGAGSSSITTSSPATSPPTASCAPSCPSRTPPLSPS